MTGYKCQSLLMEKYFPTFFQAMITLEKVWKYSSMGYDQQLFLPFFITSLSWMVYTQRYSSEKVTTILLEKVCNTPAGLVKWSSVILFVNITEPLDYRLNMSVTVFLWISNFQSMLFPLTLENCKSGKVFQVF